MYFELCTLCFVVISLLDPFLTRSMMEKTNFEKLRVYRLAESLADGIWSVVLSWNYLAKDTVGKQIVRAADSIGANIAEGSGRGSLEDNQRFIRDGTRIVI